MFYFSKFRVFFVFFIKMIIIRFFFVKSASSCYSPFASSKQPKKSKERPPPCRSTLHSKNCYIPFTKKTNPGIFSTTLIFRKSTKNFFLDLFFSPSSRNSIKGSITFLNFFFLISNGKKKSSKQKQTHLRIYFRSKNVSQLSTSS